MSLQVWLPLTKDLRNQGLSDVTVTNNGATFNSNGKLGGCYNFTNQNIVIPSTNFKSEFTNNQASLAAWVKVSTSHNTYAQALVLGTQGTSWNNILFGIDINSSGTPIANTSTGSAYTNLSFGTVIKDGVWHHIVYTYNAGTMTVYLDGVQKATKTTSNTPAWTSSTNLYIGGNTAGEKFQNGDGMNDVRVYNHCLSPMEVKQISQGLILHYPLNRQGWGQENLMPGTYRADGNNSSKVYGWENNGYGTPEIIVKDGNECIHLQANCSNATTPSIRSASKLLLENGVEYTVSCDLMYDKEIKVTSSTPIHYHNGSTDSTDPFNMTNVNNGKGFSWKSIKPVSGTIIPANTWQHYEMHFTALATPSDSSLPYSTYRAFIYGSVRTVSETTTVNMWLKNWKIEKGSIATPWCPNSSDTLADTMGLNTNIEYDTSGFNNNGTRTGTFSWISDTPKYTVSTKITPNSNIQFTPMLTGAYSWTIAAWIKPAVANNNGKVWFSVEQNTYWQITCYSNQLGIRDNSIGGTGTRKNYSFGTIAANTWIHLVATYDNGTLKLYNNGVLQNTNTVGGTYLNAMNNGRWGSAVEDGYYWNGQISDARIYATALSASDVKSLYQNCATIGADGKIYGQIRA